MDTLQPSSVTVTTLDLAPEDDNSATVVSHYKDLLDSRMYVDGPCERCSPVTSHCRGHLGKLCLRGRHVKYVYAEKAASLCKLICSYCHLPRKLTASGYTIQQRRIVYTLREMYGNVVCVCTGESKEKPYLADKLHRVYDALEAAGSDGRLRELCGLGTRREVFTAYLYVPPYKTLEQLREGHSVIACYVKLLDYVRKSDWDYGEEASLVEGLYKAITRTMQHKEGIFRHIILPRKVPNSARAVIISDPYIGISEVSLSNYVARRLRGEVEVTTSNIYSIAESIASGDVTHVGYGKRCYQLASNAVFLRVTNCYDYTAKRIQGVTLGAGNIVTVKETGRSVTLGRGSYEEIHQLLRGTEILQLHLGATEKYTTLQYREVYFTVQILNKVGDERTVVMATLQMGCTVMLPREGQKILLHRNPVLSAGSIRVHDMHIVRTDLTDEMTTTERMQQREKIKRSKHCLLLGNVKDMGIARDADHVIIGTPVYRDPASKISQS